MTLSASRNGNFTSSEMYRLVTYQSRPMTDEEQADYKLANPKGRKTTIYDWPGIAAVSFIQECIWERRLNRSCTSETASKATTWGKVCESIAFSRLGFDYTLCSTETITHPDFPYWCGTPDVISSDAVGDIKCPFTLISFCKMVDCLTSVDPIRYLRDNHPDGDKYYFQLVSNAILTNKNHAELIVFCPMLEDLAEIRLAAMDYDFAKWIEYATDDELPYLLESGQYKSLNTIRFEVPQSDKDLLTDLVERAGKLLV